MRVVFSESSSAPRNELTQIFQEADSDRVVVNTSFNENEPIVDTPEQALDCFLRTDMDALVMGRQVLVKQEK